MDVNGTKFHALLGREDWTGRGTVAGGYLVWDERDASIRLRSRVLKTEATKRKDRLDSDARSSVAHDRYGNVYWLDGEQREIWFQSWEGDEPICYWSIDDWSQQCAQEKPPGSFKPCVTAPEAAPITLRGLTVTMNDYLVVGVVEPPGLLVFDLDSGGPPHRILWPEVVSFAPLDMAAAPDGGVFILDAGDPPRYWALDANLQVQGGMTQTMLLISPPQTDGFSPCHDSQTRCEPVSFPSGVELKADYQTEAIAPLAIEALADGSVLILYRRVSDSCGLVAWYKGGRYIDGRALDDVLKQISLIETTAACPLLAHDFAFATADEQPIHGVAGTLYVAVIDRNQIFAFDFQAGIDAFELIFEDHYLPTRTLDGRGLITRDGYVYYDTHGRWRPVVEQRAPYYREDDQNDEKNTIITRILDGREIDCVWHRVFLDAVIPGGCEVQIESWCANDKKLLPDKVPEEVGTWRPQPKPYVRPAGAELPYHQPYPKTGDRPEGGGTWELLLQEARGRYLVLRIRLKTLGRNTPRLRALRVYYPRFSYLNEYLPAVYRDDKASASFLERFLANTEGTLTAIEDCIAQAQVLFDADTVPVEYLDWLAGWFGLMFEEGWDENRRRLLLRHAMELFAQRGTAQGLIRAIRLATDPCPDDALFEEDVNGYYRLRADEESRPSAYQGNHIRIVEDYLLRRAAGVVFGDPTDLEGPSLTPEQTPWAPEQGAEKLQKDYREYLQTRYKKSIDALNAEWNTSYDGFPAITLPPVRPDNDTEVAAWVHFIDAEIGFTYAAVTRSDSDTADYCRFLARRYRTVDRLNTAWDLPEADRYRSFDEIPLPSFLPDGGKRLFDWIQFVSVVLPTQRHAHRFTVLVPYAYYGATRRPGPDPDVVHRVVELEKPAHTTFDVKRYWAMFRVGEARVGMETLVDEGARLAPMILGEGYLEQGYLDAPDAWKSAGRTIVGRDRVASEQRH